MRVAALYDVHANLPGLEAVLAEIPQDPRIDVTPEEQLAPSLAGAPPTVVCGHSHLRFVRAVGSTRVVNAGSVGVVYEDEPGAYWPLLGPGVELRRTPFEPAALEPAGFPRPRPTPGRAEATALLEADAVGT